MVNCQITMSLDGYVAGPDQSEEIPLGRGGEELHEWMFQGTETDAKLRAALHDNLGAFVMGRNMFGPVRGEWDRDWRGWWGDDPPYHAPVFVLTHYERAPVEMQGGTTFHFVTDGIEAALERARAAAGDKDVHIAGGASTVNQYLRAGLIEELHLHVSPRLLGAGERLFADVGDLGIEPVEVHHSPKATHIRYRIS